MSPVEESLGGTCDPPPSLQHWDVAEFELFYNQHYMALVRYLAALTGSAHLVEDAAQEAMLTVSMKWTLLHSPKGYLFVTARNALNRMLRNPDSRNFPLDLERHDAVCRDLASDWIETFIDVVRLLHELPARQREAATLAWLCDCPEREIAQILDVAPGTVKRHLSRARNTLRRIADEAAQLDEPGRSD